MKYHIERIVKIIDLIKTRRMTFKTLKNKILNFFHFILRIFNLKIFFLKGKRKSYDAEVEFDSLKFESKSKRHFSHAKYCLSAEIQTELSDGYLKRKG